jgi:Ca2+-binding RTX toxin-like protein
MTSYVGSEHGNYPFSAVVDIHVTFPNGVSSGGSGAVVGQNDVLTSAHVIYSAADGGLAEEIVVYPGRDGGETPYGSYSADYANYFQIDQDGDDLLSQADSEEDIAVLGFDTRIADQTGQFGIDPIGGDGYYNLTGYPGVYADMTGPRMTNDYGYATLGFGYDLYYLDGPNGLEVNSGNSGGPLWHYVGGGPAVVGVLSTDGWATDVFGHMDTLDDWIAGNDSLLGGGHSDRVDAGTNEGDWISGTDGSETIYGQDGADTVFGADGADAIYGNRGLDMLSGGPGDDRLFGGQNAGEPSYDVRGNLRMMEGTETIFGGAGDDLMYGNFGADVLRGDGDDDTIFGGQGGDLLEGGAGADTLFGNRGDDTLDGGGGYDAFFLQPFGGDDVITELDWDSIETSDKIHIRSGLNGTDIDDFDALQSRMTETAGGDTLIDLGQDNSVRIEGVSPDWFIESDFVFY